MWPSVPRQGVEAVLVVVVGVGGGVSAAAAETERWPQRPRRPLLRWYDAAAFEHLFGLLAAGRVRGSSLLPLLLRVALKVVGWHWGKAATRTVLRARPFVSMTLT